MMMPSFSAPGMPTKTGSPSLDTKALSEKELPMTLPRSCVMPMMGREVSLSASLAALMGLGLTSAEIR